MRNTVRCRILENGKEYVLVDDMINFMDAIDEKLKKDTKVSVELITNVVREVLIKAKSTEE